MKRFLILLLLCIPLILVEGQNTREYNDSIILLDEINIVAVKQESRLRGEPVSSTVIGQSELEQLNTVSMKGISDIVPNFYIPDYGSRVTSSIYVRGIGARMDQPAVGLTIDNVPYLNKNAFDFDLADIASVDMLRGPQSTLFGRNTMAGLINITTLSPRRWQGWRMNVRVGMYNDWAASLGWYHKFNNKTALAAIMNFNYLGGFFKNQYTNKHLDHEASGALRLKLYHHLADGWDMQNVCALSLLNQGGYPYEYINTGEINYNDPAFYKRFHLNDGLTLNYRHDKFTMTSVTTIQYLDDNLTLDQDFLPESYFTLTQKQKEFGFTEDLVFKGKALSDKYHWMTGIFGFYKHLDMKAPVTFKSKGIEELIVSNRNNSNPEYPIEWFTDTFELNSDFIMPAGGVALYHESRFETGPWSFSAAIRIDWERTSLNYHSYTDTGYRIYHIVSGQDEKELYSQNKIVIDERNDLYRSYLNWMPRLTLEYRFLEDYLSNVYINVSKGWKSGGYNTQMFSDVLQQRLMGQMGIGATYDVDEVVGYKPEYSWNYEVGTHLNLIKGKLMIDISAFYIDCRDQQLTMFPDGTTTGRIMTNAGRTHNWGMELSVDWAITDRVFLNGSYGYTNARFVEFFDGINNYAGNYLPYSPKNTIFGQALWRYPVNNKIVKAIVTDINCRAAGKIYWNEANTLSQPIYALLGAGITCEGEKWSLQLWGKNLTNTQYYTFYFKSMGNEFLQRGRPLQIGVTFRYTL